MHRLVIAAIALTAALPASAQSGWAGRYVFDADLGRDGLGKGLAIGVTHTLVLGGKAGCVLQAEGYQTDTYIRCTATPAGTGVRIAFKSHRDGSLVNDYGVAQYKPGATLFTLTRGKRGVVTTWGVYEPDGIKGRSGVYFRKG